MILRKMINNIVLFLTKTVFYIITFLLTWCMHIQNNDITPATSQNYIGYPINNIVYSRNY